MQLPTNKFAALHALVLLTAHGVYKAPALSRGAKMPSLTIGLQDQLDIVHILGAEKVPHVCG